jgi:tRNA A37 N6-isopentenylltransferase MiaA
MGFEDRLFAWHRLYSDLQDVRLQLNRAIDTRAAASDLQQLRERADSLDQQSASAMHELETARAAELQRTLYWREDALSHPGSTTARAAESRAGDRRERARSPNSSRPT